jgi:hypothetical protein
MYNETQLQAIKTFWKKDLEIWCKIFFKDSKQPFTFTWEIWVFVWNPDFEILWHIPHLEDLFRVAEEYGIKLQCLLYQTSLQWYTLQFEDSKKVYDLIDYIPTLPLLDQPNLSEIVNLFSK